MRTSKQMFLLGMLSALSAAAVAGEGASPAAPDTSQWKCEACTFEQGVSGTLDAGIGTVSEKSSKFGEYNGLNKSGGFFIGDGNARYRGADAAYWNLNASNLGLHSRFLGMEGGEQGKYKLLFKYDELLHAIGDTVQTPYGGSGGTTLTLPAGFPAATTAAMPLGSLQQIDLGTQRKRLGLGAAWTPATDWEYALNFRHETKDGSKRTAGAFFVNSAQLVEPVDTTTNLVDASAAYNGARLQAKFAYHGSTFNNQNQSLTFQNAFTFLPGFPGAGTGQLALPPSNEFHQALASLGYQFSAGTRASADVAVGRMTQNQDFLALTQNATLAAAPMPGSALNGRAGTLDATLKLSSLVTKELRLNATYTRNERENNTPQASYPIVSTDMFAGLARTNLPYSFTKDKFKLSGDYKASEKLRASAGADFETNQRTYQEVSRTRDDTLWAKLASHVVDTVDVSLKLARAERRNSGYLAVPGITPPENPLMRKYTMAGRTRQTAGLRVDIAAVENVNVGFGIDVSKDDYTASTIGLISGKEFSVNGDVSVIFTPETSLHAFGGHQEIKSTQAGSQAYATADWSGENNDTVDFVGLGLKHVAIKDKLDIGADYNISRSRGEINVITGALTPGFPDQTTRIDSLKLYATYKMKDNMSLVGSYWLEHYDSKNWMLDGVTPSTIPNVLAFGEQPPRYRVHVLRLALRYRF